MRCTHQADEEQHLHGGEGCRVPHMGQPHGTSMRSSAMLHGRGGQCSATRRAVDSTQPHVLMTQSEPSNSSGGRAACMMGPQRIKSELLIQPSQGTDTGRFKQLSLVQSIQRFPMGPVEEEEEAASGRSL
jgi:hypothetical protein